MLERTALSVYFITALILGPALVIGIIRKTKARLQTRTGAPLFQALQDLIKLYRKGETISKTASWVFRFAALFNAAVSLILAVLLPWIGFTPYRGPTDLFLVMYLFVSMRFFTLLAAMDTGSSFGAFAASREVTLSFLVEPAAILSLAALAVINQTSDLSAIFNNYDFNSGAEIVWFLSGASFLLASLVDCSRMPIDDPTTHLELTMVHEALILESSGKNLALTEGTAQLKLAILLGLSSQCFVHALVPNLCLKPFSHAVVSVAALMLTAAAVGIFESLSVKLSWRKSPWFIAYIVTLSFISALVALGVKST